MELSRAGWGETSLPVAFQNMGGRRAPWGCAAGAPYRGTASPPPPCSVCAGWCCVVFAVGPGCPVLSPDGSWCRASVVLSLSGRVARHPVVPRGVSWCSAALCCVLLRCAVVCWCAVVLCRLFASLPAPVVCFLPLRVCCVCAGLSCCVFPVLSALCGAVLRCAGALSLCCARRLCCFWWLVLLVPGVAAFCWRSAGGSGCPALSFGGVCRLWCPCLVWPSLGVFPVVSCSPVLCTEALCCRVVLCCGALSSFFVFLLAGGAGFLLFPVGSGLRAGSGSFLFLCSARAVLCWCACVVALCSVLTCPGGAGWRFVLLPVVFVCLLLGLAILCCLLVGPGGSWCRVLVACCGGSLGAVLRRVAARCAAWRSVVVRCVVSFCSVWCCRALCCVLGRCPSSWGPAPSGAVFCLVPPRCVCFAVGCRCVVLFAVVLCAVCALGCRVVRFLSCPPCAVLLCGPLSLGAVLPCAVPRGALLPRGAVVSCPAALLGLFLAWVWLYLLEKTLQNFVKYFFLFFWLMMWDLALKFICWSFMAVSAGPQRHLRPPDSWGTGLISRVPTSLNSWLNHCVHLPRLIGFGDIYWVKRLDQSWISDYCDWEHRLRLRERTRTTLEYPETV